MRTVKLGFVGLGPRDLSPLLSVLDDRVVQVTCMSTRPSSYRLEGFPTPDIEVALMRTAGDAILRIDAGFNIPTPKVRSCGHHWYHIVGTEGQVETNRSDSDSMKLWLADSFLETPMDAEWTFPKTTTPPAALQSGHGVTDYYPIATFVDCIRNDTDPQMDVYAAVGTAAPAIMAARSAEEGSACLPVPDVRPGEHRKPGQMP